MHGLATGSDAKQGWMLILTAACVVVVLAAVAWRAGSDWPAHRGIKATALGATVVAPIAFVAWLIPGPLGAGWARRSGTPASVLAAVGAGGSAPASSTASKPGLHVPFSAQLSGSSSQATNDNGDAVVKITTTMSSGASGSMNVTITGQPLDNGGVSMTSGAVMLGPVGQPQLYRGRITALEGSRFEARVSDGSSTINLSANVRVDGAGSVSGTVSAQ